MDLHMKKRWKLIPCLLAACLLLASLSGCIVIPLYHLGLRLYGDSPVCAVQLYDLNRDGESSRAVYNYADLEEKYVPIAVLSETDWDSICGDLQALWFSDEVIVFPPVALDPNLSFFGYVIRVEYENGNCELVSNHFCAYRENGTWKGSTGICDTEDWDALLQWYFPDALS